MSTMWKNEAARARMQEWHGRFRAAIAEPLESRTVPTSRGETHVLIGGASDAPPVVVLHGALATSAHILHEMQTLFRAHRVYGVDIVGQSAMSADVRLPVDDESAGLWLAEVLDGLGLTRVAIVGVSWGGFVAQRLATVAPDRVSSLVLVVPAGLVTGPKWRGFVEMGWPMTRYLFSQSASSRDDLLAALLTTPDDPLWAPYLADAFLAANMRTMKIPKLSADEDFRGLTGPVYVIGADRDVSFPGDLVVARARTIFPTLRSAELLAETRHSPATTPTFRAEFGARLCEMLAP